ncbi:MAG: hypothetical protein KF813_11630, partial [Trueperaceae bacterium]|nr:hypothetical protein [Trueperaceae bacterium]
MTAGMTADVTAALAALNELGGQVKRDKDMLSVTVEKSQLILGLEALKSHGYLMLTDIFGIDYLTYP